MSDIFVIPSMEPQPGKRFTKEYQELTGVFSDMAYETISNIPEYIEDLKNYEK